MDNNYNYKSINEFILPSVKSFMKEDHTLSFNRENFRFLLKFIKKKRFPLVF